MVRERNRRDDQIDAALIHAPALVNAIVVRHQPISAARFDAFHADGSCEHAGHRRSAQPVFANDFGHLGDQLLVLRPLRLQRMQDLALAFGVDDVDFDFLNLQVALNAVYGLDEVVELEANAGVNRLMAVPLKVAAGAGQDRLRRQVFDLAFAKIDHRLLAFFEVLVAVDADRIRHGVLERVPFRLEVVPDQVVRIRIRVEQLADLCDPRRQRIALLPSGVHDAQRRIAKQIALTVAIGTGRRMVDFDLVVDDSQRRQFIPYVVEAEVGGPLQE